MNDTRCFADYNRDKDRVTIEETFANLIDLVKSLDEEQRRATREALSEDELALFDLLNKERLSKTQRERIKQASKSLIKSIRTLIAPLEHWTEKEQTQAEVEVFILDHVYDVLPTPPYSDEDKDVIAKQVYQHVWEQSASGGFAQS